MGWDTIQKAAAVVAVSTFLGSAGLWTWELFTIPDRDVIGSVVSLHALYFGGAVGSTVLALACSWSGISWAIGFCKQWKDKRNPSNQLQRMYKTLVREFNAIEQEEMYPLSGRRSNGAKYAQRAMLKIDLMKIDIGTPDAKEKHENDWYWFLTNLIPLAKAGHIKEARLVWSQRT